MNGFLIFLLKNLKLNLLEPIELKFFGMILILFKSLRFKSEHSETPSPASKPNQREMTVAPSAINDLTLLMWAELPIVSDNGRTSRKKEFLYSRPFTPGHVRFITSLNRSCQATRTQRLAGLAQSDAKTLRRP